MKVTLLTIGSHGDVRPYVALGVGLKKHGYEVTIATHLEFQPFIEKNGLQFFLVAGNPKEVIQGIGGQELLNTGRNPIAFLKKFKAAARDSMIEGFDQCLEACRGADLIIAPFMVMNVAYLIGQKLKIPLVLGFLQPTSSTAAFPIFLLHNLFLGGFLNRRSYDFGHFMAWQIFKDVLIEWEEKTIQSGRRLPWTGFQRKMFRSEFPILYGFSPVLLPRPKDWPKWAHLTGFWLLKSDAYTPDPALEAFIKEGEKPVYVGFGSMSNSDPQATTDLVIDAINKVGVRGILLSGWGGMETESLPDHIFPLEQAPHDWLFPQMAAVAHHCGAGTTATGLKAGVPNVLIPFFGDQPFWAQRMFGMGYGPRPIPRSKLTSDRLASALDSALNTPRYTERTKKARIIMNEENGVEKAVQLIDRFLSHKKH